MNAPTGGCRRKESTFQSNITTHETRLLGVLLGTATGDAIGLPCEGLAAKRIALLKWTSPLTHRFLLGRGMMSDDSEHTLMTANAWMQCPDNSVQFQRAFARKLRWWVLGLPAGVGLATARACFKLWVGIPPQRTGVYSAGNGGAMRSAILGVLFNEHPDRREAFTQALVEITHRDPRALVGARAVTEAVAMTAQLGHPLGHLPTHAEVLAMLRKLAPEDSEWQDIVNEIERGLQASRSVADFWLGHFQKPDGVSGYVYHTVPVALYAWLHCEAHFERAVTAVIALGGDTDTVAAITGALCGATHGTSSIPQPWLDRLTDWPRSRSYILRLSHALANPDKPPPRHLLFIPSILLRNIVFLIVVLIHGILRYVPGDLRVWAPSRT